MPFTLACGVGLILPVAAHAALEEIAVTAQKRSESLQDEPIAIGAFSSETMKALGIIEASDLVNVTAGLTRNRKVVPIRTISYVV